MLTFLSLKQLFLEWKKQKQYFLILLKFLWLSSHKTQHYQAGGIPSYLNNYAFFWLLCLTFSFIWHCLSTVNVLNIFVSHPAVVTITIFKIYHAFILILKKKSYFDTFLE